MVWEKKTAFFPLRKKDNMLFTSCKRVGKMSRRDIQLCLEELGKRNEGPLIAFSQALQC